MMHIPATFIRVLVLLDFTVAQVKQHVLKFHSRQGAENKVSKTHSLAGGFRSHRAFGGPIYRYQHLKSIFFGLKVMLQTGLAMTSRPTAFGKYLNTKVLCKLCCLPSAS